MNKIIVYIIIFASLLFPQEMLIIEKEYIPYPDTTLVFLPSDISPEKSYPLLIMLHGWTGDYNQWNEIIPLQHLADDYGFIIASPDGFSDCWYVNSPVNPNSQFETFFIKDLLPTLLSQYPVDPMQVFITGLSMGGHGAITLYLKYPNQFKSAGSTSGILDLTKFPGKWGLNEVLGPIEEAYDLWAVNSAVNLLPNIVGTDKTMIIDCGTEDFALSVNKEFAAVAALHNVKIRFTTPPGNHSRDYWRSSIISHIQFFRSFNR
jgi:putative tributyrin esterase